MDALQSATLFRIVKTPPYSLQPGFSVREEPIEIVKQEKLVQGARKKTSKEFESMCKDIIKIPFEMMDEEDLENKCRELGYEHFIDPSFPPDDSSIYDVVNESSYPLSERVVWKRPHEFMHGRPALFENEIIPNDINQGALGNCWFLASIASLAENPALVKRLFLTDRYNEFGIYRIKICKNGEWVVVTIDDYIPCYLHGGPMFSSANGNELWAILLEKAYAKLHGNYWQLRAGYVHHGMMDLSGCPTFRYNFPEDRHDYSKISDFVENLWVAMTDADKRGHIM